MTAPANALCEAALEYAERFGWPVAPVWPIDPESGACACPAGADCRSPGKHPLAAHGLGNATIDPDATRG